MTPQAKPRRTILQTVGLSKKFGSFQAIRDVSLSVAEGGVHSVIGPNGAGKSTLFNLLAGALTPSSGTIRFGAQDITALPDSRRVRAGIARSFQVTSLFRQLSVLDNLRLAAQGVMPGRSLRIWEHADQLGAPRELANRLIVRLGLERHATAPAGTLAHGQQRMLEVGMCLAARPKLLLLDEPTSGMGVNDLPRMRNLIQELGSDHTVVLIEHNMSIVMDISDRITVLSQGSVLTEGLASEIQEHAEVRRAYMGNTARSGPHGAPAAAHSGTAGGDSR
jgi:branched-chain amino acid transport system ATP-binding protein